MKKFYILNLEQKNMPACKDLALDESIVKRKTTFPDNDVFLPFLLHVDGDKNDAGVQTFMKLISIVGVFLSFLSMACSRLTWSIVFSFAGDWLRMTVSIHPAIQIYM